MGVWDLNSGSHTCKASKHITDNNTNYYINLEEYKVLIHYLLRFLKKNMYKNTDYYQLVPKDIKA